uniref:glycogen debranching N-terminal domain-containing protein n=1 Tax=Pseudonocardia sp. TRM90224 TaxID=2812678 RepID=UPI00272EE16C
MTADPGSVPDEGPPQGVLAGPGTITVIAGLTFVVSDELGDVNAGPLGLIADDTRHLSQFEVMIEGKPLRHLGSGLISPSVARFRSYATLQDHRPDAPVECERNREVSAGGMAESITLRCWTLDPVRLRLSIRMGADFADIFQVRQLAGDPSASAPGHVVRRSAADLCLLADETLRTTTVLLDPPPDELTEGQAEWDVDLHRNRPWTLRIEMQARRGDDNEDRASPTSQARPATLQDPLVRSRPEHLARGCRRSLVDLDALGIPDELDSSRRLLAAGIPWFVALFGRDALISSY